MSLRRGSNFRLCSTFCYPFQLHSHIVCRLKPLIRILLQTRLHDVVEHRWRCRLHTADWFGIFLQNSRQNAQLALAFESTLPGRHFVKNTSEAEDVAARVSLGSL